jgi:hypothetical protein
MLAGSAAEAGAQAAPRLGLRDLPFFGVGYVANAPNLFLGVGGYVVLDVLGGLGVYVDTKWDNSTPADESRFVRGLTPLEAEEEFGDVFFREHTSWSSLSAAVVRPVSDELALYLGGGRGRERRFAEYYDDTHNRGELGYYIVDDAEGSGDRLNVMGGGMLRLTPRLLLHVGGETAPIGMTVGVSIRLGG